MKLQEYIELLENDLLEAGCGDFKRCENCERVFHVNDMFLNTDYCERCGQFVDACEAERISLAQDFFAEEGRD